MSVVSDPVVASLSTPPVQAVKHIDRELLQSLRDGEAKSIGDLVEVLGVTATAVRLRVDRLMDQGLIDREKIVAGRGRPTYRYLLTVDGYRAAGADTGLLAEALWRSILDIDDESVRQEVIAAVARRMGQQMRQPIEASLGSDKIVSSKLNGARPGERELLREQHSFAERMRLLSQLLRSREVAADLGQTGALPVLDIGACPYPSLTDASEDRSMCRLEEQMLSEALGETVKLSQCRLDGDSCCQFSKQSSEDAISVTCSGSS